MFCFGQVSTLVFVLVERDRVTLSMQVDTA